MDPLRPPSQPLSSPLHPPSLNRREPQPGSTDHLNLGGFQPGSSGHLNRGEFQPESSGHSGREEAMLPSGGPTITGQPGMVSEHDTSPRHIADPTTPPPWLQHATQNPSAYMSSRAPLPAGYESFTASPESPLLATQKAPASVFGTNFQALYSAAGQPYATGAPSVQTPAAHLVSPLPSARPIFTTPKPHDDMPAPLEYGLGPIHTPPVGPTATPPPGPVTGPSPRESTTALAQSQSQAQGAMSPFDRAQSQVQGAMSPFDLDTYISSSPVTPLSDYHRPSPSPALSATGAYDRPTGAVGPTGGGGHVPASRVLFTPGLGPRPAAPTARATQNTPSQISPVDYSPTHFTPTSGSFTEASSEDDEVTQTASVNFDGGRGYHDDGGRGHEDDGGAGQVTSAHLGLDHDWQLATPRMEPAGGRKSPHAPMKPP